VGLGDAVQPNWGPANGGVRHTHQEYPPGAPGVRKSLTEMARLMREARLDAAVCGYAADVLKAAGIDGRDRSRWTARNVTQALLENVRQVVIYSPDPLGAEMITSPAGQLCLRPGLCIRKEDCIPEGTLLLRDDYELVPIEKLKIGDRIWGKDKWSRVEAVVPKGKLAVDAIELNNGSTMCLTGEHKVYVGRCEHGAGCTRVNCQQKYKKMASYDRIKVSELAEGDVLLRPDRIAFGSQEPNADRLYVDGLYLSEGWNDGERFSISGQDGCRKESLKHEVKAICERLGISTYWNRKYIRVNDSIWAHKLAHRGTRARFKNAETLNLGEAAAAALLRGIMSDSTSSGKKALGRTFNTTSRTLAIQTRVLHRMFGVSMSMRMLTPEQHGGLGTHPLWRMGTRARSENAEHAEWTLSVRSIDREVRKVPCWDIQTEDHYVYLPEHDVTVSNCDGLTTLLGALVMCCGFQVWILKQSWGPSAQEHVLLAVQDESGNKLKADPSHANLPVGSGVPAQSEEYYDPLDANPSIKVGAGNAEIVTFGALPQDRGNVIAMRPRAMPQHQINSQLTPGVGRATGFGVTTPTELQVVIDQTTSLMDSTNSAVGACAAMAQSDVTAWNGVYSGWQSAISGLNDCLGQTLPSIHTECVNPPYSYTLGGEWQNAKAWLLGYQAQARTWQAKVKLACPSYQPTPPLPTPVPSPGDTAAGSWADDAKSVATVLGGALVLGVASYAVYKGVQVASNYANARAARAQAARTVKA